jgi:predicted nucleic acid-binding protein
VIVVSDTSALSNLVLVEHLWLLEAIYRTVIIPEVVASELIAASNSTISGIPKLSSDYLECQDFFEKKLLVSRHADFAVNLTG